MARDSEQGKEHFVPGEERPEVRLDPNKLIGELRVRDLQAILGGSIGKTLLKWEKPEKLEKIEKTEKLEKLEKVEKFEKFEVLDKHVPDFKLSSREPLEVIDPRILPEILQVVQRLTERLDKLGDQLADLQKRAK